MPRMHTDKYGFTLIEVLVVVSIIGILSSMGVVGLQGAVANSRVKDAAMNTAAFLERVGNLSKQQSVVICLAIAPGTPRKLLALKSKGTDCSGDNKLAGGALDSMMLEDPMKFVENKSGTCNFVGAVDMVGENAAFKPRIGLSSVPEGVVCVQHADDMRFGIARKQATLNSVKPFWKLGNDDGASGWFEL